MGEIKDGKRGRSRRERNRDWRKRLCYTTIHRAIQLYIVLYNYT